VGFLDRWLSNRALTKLRERLVGTPSIASYADLARAFVASNDFANAERVLEEGLESFPSSSELERLKRLVRQHRLADRIHEVRRRIEMQAAPALYHELVELQLQCNDFNSADATCADWRKMFPADSGAELAAIKISLRRFYKDRAANDGRAAIAGLERLLARDPGHARALRLTAELCSRIGALPRALEALTRLAQIVPEDPGVEMWRKKVEQAIATTKQRLDVNRSLREVEETGQFPDPVPSSEEELQNQQKKSKKSPRALDSSRPALSRLGKIADVRLVILVRGSEALVRGSRPGTAEAVARATRAVAITAKRATRRMGLGAFQEAVIETDTGSLVLRAGDPSCAAAVVDKLTQLSSVRSAVADLASAPPTSSADVASDAEGELVRA
jgi:predicted regulator of Ras-like GTPase activity (Roadblock/LC7/MglB family)